MIEDKVLLESEKIAFFVQVLAWAVKSHLFSSSSNSITLKSSKFSTFSHSISEILIQKIKKSISKWVIY